MSLAGASSLVGSLPSPFGGFAPFPNSIMIPFMGTQSAVLGYNFGIAYEIGKRTIKAMDNDLFNRIVSGSNDKINIIRNGIETTISINQYIPTLVKAQASEQIQVFQDMIPSFMKLQDTIIDKSVDIELKKADRTPSAMVEILQTLMGSSSVELRKFIDGLPPIIKQGLFQIFPFIATLYGDGLIAPAPEPPELEPAPFVPAPEPEPVPTAEPEPTELPPSEPVQTSTIQTLSISRLIDGRTYRKTWEGNRSYFILQITELTKALNNGVYKPYPNLEKWVIYMIFKLQEFVKRIWGSYV